jgi:hypothetical protein
VEAFGSRVTHDRHFCAGVVSPQLTARYCRRLLPRQSRAAEGTSATITRMRAPLPRCAGSRGVVLRYVQTITLLIVALAAAACVGIAVHPSKPVGAWKVAASGHDYGVDWTVRTTRGTNGGTCVSVDTHPDLGGVSVQQGADGSSTSGGKSSRPTHLGRSANCVFVGDPNANIHDEPDNEPKLLAVADVESVKQDGQGPHYALLVVNPNASDVTVVFSDKSTQRVDPVRGIAFVIWHDARKLTFVTLKQPGFEPPLNTCTAHDGLPLLRDLGGASCHNA